MELIKSNAAITDEGIPLLPSPSSGAIVPVTAPMIAGPEYVELSPDLPADDFDGNSMKLNLQTGALSVQLETRVAAKTEIIELTCRLDITTKMLHDTQQQLAAAQKRIGYLEALLLTSAENR